ncbi:MAG TPA: flagellar basal-body rod protein FlgG [Candidatus Saccharimonadales bacterium]|nr:flagellar basal-body rod protein FlgG [Candidatus Saccharimonadales bacterium]
MIRAMRTAASGMLAQQTYVDTIAHNLANVNTTGYKKSRVQFQDLLYQTVRPAAGGAPGTLQQMPVALQIGHGTRLVGSPKIFAQGDSETTGNPLDLLIEGDGFLQFTRPDGTLAYSRDGSLRMDEEGRLVSSEGLPLQPEISIPAEATGVQVAKDGTVSVTIPGTTDPQRVGQIELARFINEPGLSSEGSNLYVATSSSGQPITGVPGQTGMGNIQQGFLERSNVEVVEEMVDMIVAQRAYEVNGKSIQAADEMMSQGNNIRR